MKKYLSEACLLVAMLSFGIATPNSVYLYALSVFMVLLSYKTYSGE